MNCILFFSGWNLWQLDGGQLCQEPGPLAGDHEDDTEDEDDEGDDDSDDVDLDVDSDVGAGEHDQPAAGQHLLLQSPHRLLGQGEPAYHHDDYHSYFW